MDVTYDLTDVLEALKQADVKIDNALARVGQEAVDYAKEHGSYKNRTGNLRRSNKYRVDDSGLTVYNDAPYASDVEQKGYDVLSGAALFAEKRLKEELGE